MQKFHTQRLSFTGSQGHKLDARLEHPDGEAAAFALVAHCFTCSKDYIAPTRISRALAERGIATLRFDFTGLGASEGDFADTNFSTNVADTLRAAEFLRERYQAPKLLIGHSLGGTAALVAATQVPESLTVATIAAPSAPDHVTQHFAARLPDIDARGQAQVEIAGRGFVIRTQLIEDMRRHDLDQVIAELDLALFVFHSPADTIVDVKHAQRIFSLAPYPKTLVLLDQADHLLTRRQDAEYVADLLAAWMRRADGNSARHPAALTVGSAGEVVVSETREGRYVQCITAGRHSLNADEPREYGGDDSGPSPYDLLLASLGACTSMTIRMYAERKQLALQQVEVRLRHARIHARDCADCETKEGRIDRIERVIRLRGDLDAGQRANLLAIADKCPVHRTLHGEVSIATRLDEG
jgi:putative redox protein